MDFGNDQLDSTYSERSDPFTVKGPSFFLGEMSSGGLVPPGTESGNSFDYVF